MPSLTITNNEINASGGIPTGTGTAFIAGVTDQAPPVISQFAGAPYVRCQSIVDYTTAFGPRSSTSALLYDWLDEFFHDGGQAAYVARVTDATAAAASLALQDAGSHPTVLVSALSPGLDGNSIYVAVLNSTGATFTATVTSGSPNLTAISSTRNIGVGTPVSGAGIPNGTTLVSVNSGANSAVLSAPVAAGAFTATTVAASATLTAVSSFTPIAVGSTLAGPGIPANTTVVSVNTGASTLVMSAPATAAATGVSVTVTGTPTTGVTVTPGAFTVQVQDAAGDILETHGPYNSDAQLVADTSSPTVAFAQSTAPGNTTNIPAVQSATPLAGGQNATDLTDASHVNALAAFPAILGPGTVALPGKTGITAWQGLATHAQANDRFYAADMVDSPSAQTLIAALGAFGGAPGASSGTFIAGSLILPGVAPYTTRTAPGSAAVAALRAQVAQTASQNQAPAGQKWPLSYPLGFTQSFGPSPSPTSLPAGQYTQNDVNSLSAAGINVFANFYGPLCLFGFVSPVPKSVDQTYWQASAAAERMALTAECQRAMAPYLFDTIDGAGNTLGSAEADLKALIQTHWRNNALYGANASDAGAVNMGPPINTPTTEAAGQLNANLQVRISPYADAVNVSITTVAITQQVT